MSDAKEAAAPAAPAAHPIWVDLGGQIQKDMTYRDGDIVVSVPAKSGTTWTMNIVHQLRSGGDPDMRDLYEQVPWLEFFETPTQAPSELINRWSALPTWFPRAFKTHSAFGQNNFEYLPNVKYVVVMRDPVDTAPSFLKFLHKHTDEAIAKFQCPHMVPKLPMEGGSDMIWGSPFLQSGNAHVNFLKGWWPYRAKDNVLVLHFADMKKDHVGSVKKIADFMGVDLPKEKFDKVCELTSFKYMKENGEKYAIQHLLTPHGYQILEADGMVRTGAIGEGKTALSAPVIAAFEALIDEQLTKPQEAWLRNGGEEHLA